MSCEVCGKEHKIVTGGVWGFFTLCDICCQNLYKLQRYLYVSLEELPERVQDRNICGGWSKDVHTSNTEGDLIILKLTLGEVTEETALMFFCRECFLSFLNDRNDINRLFCCLLEE